uniref:tolloid-like protein 1 n=1 Tax=Ciona intestinalis TaxID=7719 RepID=UPI000EF45D22|nr:tolloid-like protein 1 [Ciona intestinalis]|eukprot:XP_026689471.1 tolloid-like protein 1 [Ciona intestinalis]
MRSYLRFIYFVFYLVSFWKCGASQTQSCGFNAVATTNPQIITSPGFPNNYAPGIECTWRLTTDVGMNILLTFVSFNTEKSRDFLFVDLPDRSFFSGSGVGSVVGKQLRSSNGETTLKFIADSINNRPGFNLTYRAIPAEVNCGRSAVATATPQIITSPGYPNNYPNNTICNWNISAPEGMKIRFNLKYLSTEQNFDFLKIYSKGDQLARFSGVVSNQIFISTDNELNVVFTSDNLIGGIGFNATFMEIPPCGFDAVATTTSQIITSPNYPKHYSNNEKCIWRISTTAGMRVQLQIESFFTHGIYDYLSVKSGNVNLGRLSRSYPLKIFRSSSNNMTLTFVSDKFGTYPGFRATFVAIPEQINITHCGYDTTATTTNQVITSPGYPNSYPNDAICNWTISAPEGWRIKLQIKSRTELSFDYFKILASGISGIRRSGLYDHTFYSTDNLVNLLFISDASITSSGLNTTYLSLAPCGFNAVATTARKTITSRNYPEEYIPLEDCIWKINTTAGMEIQLNFENFFIENRYDFLTITTGANQVTRLTGLHNNKAFRSTGNHMTLRFTSDGSVQKSGFNLTYFAIPGPKSTCENHYVATTTIQSISSPGYPNRYPDFLSCIWVISVPAGHRIQLFLESLDTEANFDVLSISSPDGTLARFSGSVSKRNFQSVGNFTMQFSTDNANAKTGFNVTFFAEPAATCFSGLHPVEGTPLLSKKCDLSETCATFHGSLEGANGTYHACFPKSNCLKFDCSTQHGLDYLRNISGYNVNSCEKFQCCHEDKCNKPPQSACLGNMISVDCGSGCSLPTCGQPTPLPGPCPQICRKCVCPEGQVLFENNTCIPFVQCPRKGPTCYSGIQTRTTTSLGFKQCGLNETCVTYQGMVKIEESAITDGTYFGCISKMSCSTFDCKLPAGVQYLRKTSGYNFTSCNNLQCCSGILCNTPV